MYICVNKQFQTYPSLHYVHLQLNNAHYGTLKSKFISDIHLAGYLGIPSFTDYWNLH